MTLEPEIIQRRLSEMDGDLLAETLCDATHYITVLARGVYSDSASCEQRLRKVLGLMEVIHRLAPSIADVLRGSRKYADEDLVNILLSHAAKFDCETEAIKALSAVIERRM